VRGPWLPETLADVDWALRRMAECQAEKDAIDLQEEAAIAAIKARAAVLTTKALRSAAFFEARLLAWADSHRDELGAGKKKSRDFVHGRVGTRHTGGKLVVTDKKALEAWLLAQPIERGLYRYKVEAEMRALQDLFARTGEVPPGTDVSPESDELYVKAELPGATLVKGK
jgi:phage host-nuclease inhibitor protein Gam